MRFVETLLNPVNAPMFYFSILKTLSNEDKKTLEGIYKKLIKLEVELISLDIEYKEEKEISFIKQTNKEWEEVKKDTLRIVDSIKKNWDNKSRTSANGYFG